MVVRLRDCADVIIWRLFLRASEPNGLSQSGTVDCVVPVMKLITYELNQREGKCQTKPINLKAQPRLATLF